MKLTSITVENFRSIKEATLDIKEVEDGSRTYTLIGINESGKSNFLKAVSLVDFNKLVVDPAEEREAWEAEAVLDDFNAEKVDSNKATDDADSEVSFPKDYFDQSKEIRIAFNYAVEEKDERKFRKYLSGMGTDAYLIDVVIPEKVTVGVYFDAIEGAGKEGFSNCEFREYKNENFKSNTEAPKNSVLTQEEENELMDEICKREEVEQYVHYEFKNILWSEFPRIIFWNYDSKYVSNERINLEKFSVSPRNVSPSLLNCFKLAGINEENIEVWIRNLSSHGSVRPLKHQLESCVTSHIKNIWREYPVRVDFQIEYPYLSFQIVDDDAGNNSKEIDQRSDGFRKFLSFLLTLSTENSIERLSNAVLLFDEPETHLHPGAQEDLKAELINLTKNNRDNVVIYATHSNYMIDKDHIERSYRLRRNSIDGTRLEGFEKHETTYAEVNYEVFDIPSSDYHNELYEYMVTNDKLAQLEMTMQWIKVNKAGDKLSPRAVSLPEYIRHSIHHPDNHENTPFTPEQLGESIKLMRKAKYGKE